MKNHCTLLLLVQTHSMKIDTTDMDFLIRHFVGVDTGDVQQRLYNNAQFENSMFKNTLSHLMKLRICCCILQKYPSVVWATVYPVTNLSCDIWPFDCKISELPDKPDLKPYTWHSSATFFNLSIYFFQGFHISFKDLAMENCLSWISTHDPNTTIH
jgi:hypothetical protein